MEKGHWQHLCWRTSSKNLHQAGRREWRCPTRKRTSPHSYTHGSADTRRGWLFAWLCVTYANILNGYWAAQLHLFLSRQPSSPPQPHPGPGGGFCGSGGRKTPQEAAGEEILSGCRRGILCALEMHPVQPSEVMAFGGAILTKNNAPRAPRSNNRKGSTTRRDPLGQDVVERVHNGRLPLLVQLLQLLRRSGTAQTRGTRKGVRTHLRETVGRDRCDSAQAQAALRRALRQACEDNTGGCAETRGKGKGGAPCR